MPFTSIAILLAWAALAPAAAQPPPEPLLGVEATVGEQLAAAADAARRLIAGEHGASEDPSRLAATAGLDLLCQLYLAYDLREAARSCFASVLERAPDQPNAHYLLGHLDETAGQAAAAVEHFRRAASLESSSAASRFRLGRALLLAGDPGTAAAEFGAALERDPSCLAAHLGLGEAARDRGDLAAALDNYQRALERDPDLHQARYAAAQALRALGRLAEARAELARTDLRRATLAGGGWQGCREPRLLAVQARAAGAAVHLLRGSLAHQAEDWERARSEFARAAALAPDDPVARSTLAAAEQRAGNRQRAIEHYRAAIALDPERPSLRYDLAEILRSRGELEPALVLYREALERAPDFVRARLRLADSLLAATRHQEALAHYRRALDAEPGNLAAARGQVAALVGSGQRGEALRALAQVRAEIDLAARDQLELAELALLLGDVEGASAALLEVLAHADQPELLARAHLWLGAAALGRREATRAIEHLERARLLDPTLALAESYLAQARRLPPQGEER